MRPAGPNHSNVLLVAVIGSVFGLAIYGSILWFGGWRTLLILFTLSALTWCLIIAFDRWPPP